MRFHSGRPNPTENRRTFTPLRRATQKWPNSWKVTSTPRLTIIHHTEPRKVVIAGSSVGVAGEGSPGRLAGERGGLAQRVEGRGGSGRQRCQRVFDQRRNGQEAGAALKEG